MLLSAGTRLGPYELLSAAGAGGMGEVYRARDTRLDRIVAVKVLPTALASDPQLIERFEREARSISALNHPNICTLHDVGQAAGIGPQGSDIRYIVMEFLEGETLAARLDRGALPLGEALTIALEVASALDRAHRQGIVHRDLKPGNVMLTRTGAKLLDFGLAKLGSAAPLSGAISTALPTATAPLTTHGTLLGTFQYMAPEQIEGEEADARSDMFAFGAVLFEMITGRKAFQGKTQASLLGAILKDEPPPVSQVQAVTPPALDYLVRTCLAKDRDARFQTAHDLLLQLRWIKDGGSAAGVAAPVVVHRKRRDRARWLAAVAVVAAVTAAAVWWLKPTPAPPRPLVARFAYVLPQDQNFTRPGRHVVAVSQDGSKIVYVANRQLYLRTMDQLEAQPIRGSTEDPFEPVFSPDGQWIAYFVAGQAGASVTLKKIAVAGGTPVTLGQVAPPFGAEWAGDTIVFGVNDPAVGYGIFGVPDAGGAARSLLTLDPKTERVAQPSLLNEGKHALFVLASTSLAGDEGQIVVQSLDGGARKALATGADPRILSSGHLVYIHNATLFALPFDARRLEVTGGPVPVVEGVTETLLSLAGQYAVSSHGTLVFQPGSAGAASPRRALVWVDRQGQEQSIPVKPRAYQYPRVSPDGRKIAVNSIDEEHDIWILDLVKETPTRLTFGPASEIYSPWLPDGRSVLYSSGDTAVSSARDLFVKAVDGTGTAHPMTTGKSGGAPSSISPDGRSVVYRTGNASEPNDLMLLPLDGRGKSQPLLADPKFNERNGEVSPDGRWIAYDSNESGRLEVYVRPFPNVDGGRWQVSTEGGAYPMWARSGRELFFVTTSSPQTLMRVDVQAASGFDSGKPQRLFELTPYYGTTGRTMDISPDGKRFLLVKAVDASPAGRPSIVVVSNWFEEVKARVPTAR